MEAWMGPGPRTPQKPCPGARTRARPASDERSAAIRQRLGLGIAPFAFRDHEPVPGSRNRLDFEPAADSFTGAPHGCHGAIEAVVANVDAAPAAIEQVFAGYDLTRCVGQHYQHLHHARFDVRRTARSA